METISSVGRTRVLTRLQVGVAPFLQYGVREEDVRHRGWSCTKGLYCKLRSFIHFALEVVMMGPGKPIKPGGDGDGE